jgi:hippurate hydrolase
MLEACPGTFINIGNAGTVGSYPVHNPHYDFNEAALPIGASLFARLVEKKLPRLSTT